MSDNNADNRYLRLIRQDRSLQPRVHLTQFLWRTAQVVLVATLFLLPVHISAGGGDEVLFLAVIDDGAEVTYEMVDLRSGVKTPVYTTAEHLWSGPRVSGDGPIAFPIHTENGYGLQVVDFREPTNTPVTIGINPATYVQRLAWSQDGNLLAFILAESYDGPYQLAVWDGNTIIDLTRSSAISYDGIAWSADGRLAFSTSFGSAPDSDPGEIYIWDGRTLTNFSQNPHRSDHMPTWGPDGQLAFQAAEGDDYDIFVWDGISFKDDKPDASTFVNVAPDLTAYYSFPMWTPTGDLAFGAVGSQDNRHQQIYVWDGQSATNLSQNFSLHNGCPRWSDDGRWAFATFFSSQQLLYVRDADNHTLLTVDGAYCPAWSEDGLLMFCTYDRPDWVLSVWDGQQITPIAEGREIWAQWQSGSGVGCSSG